MENRKSREFKGQVIRVKLGSGKEHEEVGLVQ